MKWSEQEYFKLRTDRNKNIITEQEQIHYRNAVVGIAGLSVGSVILATLVRTGGPKIMKLADPDIIEATNLNRVNATFKDIGRKKTEVAEQKTKEVDPFAQLVLYEDGLSGKNIKKFLLEEPKLDVFVDSMDSIEMKIASREMCRNNKIPVLMATDVGDSIILDVERFDQEEARPLLHGRLENLDLARPWNELAETIIGSEHLDQDAFRTVSHAPQLGSTAQLGGSVISYAVRKIANNQPMPSGRFIINYGGI